MLDVDTTAKPDGRIPINIDLYLPSLPCGELVTEVTDDSGSQQIHVTDTLHKLRMDRNGVPIDLPERVDFGHAIAPAFQQRKVVRLMEEAHQHLAETIGHFEHEQEEHPDLLPEEHPDLSPSRPRSFMAASRVSPRWPPRAKRRPRVTTTSTLS